jgi:hypothetical protein
MKFDLKSLIRHVAGATVTHRSDFSDLEVMKNEVPVTQEFIEKWVSPFYMKQPRDTQFSSSYRDQRNEVSDSVIDQLLGEFNWRMRSVGALFAAIEGKERCIQQIGGLLLRSDVCYAGGSYALALASFGTKEPRAYLDSYLSYYLNQKDLWFDQAEALAALILIDRTNQKIEYESHMVKWDEFVKNKPNWDLDKTLRNVSKNIDAIKELKIEPAGADNGDKSARLS